ncbi:hypothetical protein HGRIS_002085 [Hohenbuehelia grisea]|uniref:Leucine carboxyl methyltransferase 1 n=1 Tax=Hohenbuehelia grisea TaxID=104357 RepID=A0ABR3JJK4_9AGAR
MLPPLPRVQDPDASIRATDTDAVTARLSAVQKHYLQDPFIKHLVPRAHLQQPRPPLINVGTHVRCTAIDSLVDQWLELSARNGTQCQIVSLGAGSDTRFWRIATGPRKDALARYIEIDFPEVTTKKAMAIRRQKDLSSALGDPAEVQISHGGTGLLSAKYNLLGADLRQSPTNTLQNLLGALEGPLLSPRLPTLLLFECVLVYMTSEASSALIQWFVDHFRNEGDGAGPIGGIVYEMFGLQDAFGKVMLSNLKFRNVSLPGAEDYPTVESLPSRFLTRGFARAHAMTLRNIRTSCIDDVELERISKLEMLDEIEELELVLAHYAITWGLWAGADQESAWTSWGLKRKGPELERSPED